MIHRVSLPACMIFICLGTSARSQRPRQDQDRLINPQTPLQAELLAPVDAGKLSLGASVLAKTRLDWNDPACHLRAGSMVVGHIIALDQRSKQNKGSSLTIAFDHADCEGHISPFQFTLFALTATPNVDEGSPMVDKAGLFGSISARPVMGMGGQASATPPPLDLTNDMKLRDKLQNSKLPKVIQPGQVFGLKKVSLSVGTGPGGASVLTSLNSNIRLEGATQLVLMPKAAVAIAAVPPAPGPSSSAPEKTEEASITRVPPKPASEALPAAPPPEIDETNICTAPCSLVATDEHPMPSRASLAISTNSLGYTSHDLREHTAFDYESALSYLDTHSLLFTYDPHKIRQRFPLGFQTESMRTIRAVLLDPATLSVKRIVDWQVQGEGQYLWHAGNGQILVHLGHHLRLLGPGLAVLREISIPGQLEFVSTSPSGKYIAVGTLHERHTRTIHNELAQTLHIDPEEDVDVTLFDQDLAPLLTTSQSSALPPPILSDTGELRVNSTGKNRWRIHEVRWDRTDHTIASLNSECRPDLATPLPDSVFLVGCSESPLRNWYRMIRLDGHPILNGHGSPQEIEQTSGSGDQNDFVVRVVRARGAKLRGQRFRKEDLKEQEVSIYRATDGRRLFLTTASDVSLAEQSFALSPAGSQLAILSDGAISLYPIAKSVELPAGSAQ